MTTRTQNTTEAASTEGSDTQSGETIKYTGDAGVREISAADWKATGVEDQKTVTWDADNNYTVLASLLNPAALEVIKRDKNLKRSGS